MEEKKTGQLDEYWIAKLDEILLSENPEIGLQELADNRDLNYVLPELCKQIGFHQDTPYHSLRLWDHTLKVVSLVPADLELRWAALLHDIGKPYVQRKNQKGFSSYAHHAEAGTGIVAEIGARFNWPAARTERITELVSNHMKDHSPLRKADNDAKIW